jgi:hypothetical protein
MMFLVIHENLQVNERKTALYRYKQLKKSLHTKLERIDIEYRYHFPFETGVLCDLDKQLTQEHAAFAELTRNNTPVSTETSAPSNIQKDPSLKRLYRTICNLCHEDKFDKDLSDDVKQELTRLFILGKNAYKSGNIDELRHVYDLVLNAVSDSSVSVSYEQYRRVIGESDEELIRALDRQIESVLHQLRDLKNHPLYVVFKCHANKDVEGAKHIYRQMLHGKIAELTQALHQVQAARIHAAFRKQSSTFS